jgi:prepilin-type processing-associated H-X9-DG protein
MSIPFLDDNLRYTAANATKVFMELPGNQHGGACGMSFADGHADIHKWQGSFANVPVIICLKFNG